MREDVTALDAEYVTAGGIIDMRRNVATALMMPRHCDANPEVIPFQKGGEQLHESLMQGHVICGDAMIGAVRW